MGRVSRQPAHGTADPCRCIPRHCLLSLCPVLPPSCRQAYGAANYRLVGTVFQRAIVLTTLLAGLVALLWTQVESLLLLLRQASAVEDRGAGLLACLKQSAAVVTATARKLAG